MPTLHAFGDSFTYGHELSDCPANTHPSHSKLTYAALFAKYMQLDYKCHAIGFSANNQILRQIKQAEIQPDDSCIVMWSFPVRYALMLEEGYYTLDYEQHRWWWQVDITPTISEQHPTTVHPINVQIKSET